MPSEIVEAFARVRRDRPDRTVLVSLSEQRSLTCAQIWTEYEAMRETCVRAGLVARDVIVSIAGNRTAFVSLVLASFDLRLILMPADRSTTMTEALALVDRWQASGLVLAEPPSAPLEDRPHTLVPLPGGLHLVRFSGTTSASATASAAASASAYGDAAVLKLTSGSTGLPKATRTSERNLLEDTRQILEAMRIGPDDTQLGMIPISHAYGFGNLVLPILTQGTTSILRESFVPQLFAIDARTYHATVFQGVPFMYDHLLTQLAPEAWPSSLRLLTSAGARLEPETVRAFHARFGAKIHSFYGASEAGGICFDDADEVFDSLMVGRPLPGVRVTLQPGEAGAPPNGGRVHVASPAVASGYAGLSASEQEGFVDEGFLTGDLGCFDEAGRLVLTGRVSSFINVAGRKVQPDEVEQVLRQMPEIADVRVLGAPDARRGQMLVACMVPRTRTVTALDVRRFCAARLAAYKIPRQYLFLDEMPRDDRGKTSRRALEALVARHLNG
jgi:acyl-CoA synthetase (AMP-forming)/AMP-acid ligase II